MNSEPRIVYEFGPFRMDPETQLLLRDGQPVAVTPKAFETLLVLVRRSREVVSKEELLKAIWPDSFVEEGNLSQNIFKLRKVLGDSPEGNRYIVTLPGRGYRFSVPVRMTSESSHAWIAQTRSRTQIVIDEETPEPNEASRLVLALPQENRKRALLIAAFAAIAIAGLAALLLLRRHEALPLIARDSVLLADPTNLTGDSVFDHALRQGLEVQLQQSPYLNLVSRDQIQQTLRLMSKRSDTQLTGQVARDVCVRTGTAALLESSIQNVGIQYVLSLRATNCRTGDVFAQEQIQVRRKEEVLDAVSKMASKFRARAGETGATLQQHNVPLAQATTASIEALKAYSLGLEAEATQGEEASIPFFRRAVELDPNFAMAYAHLGLEYGSSGSSQLAADNIRKAYELADHVSDNERFFISAYYSGRATGNQEKARQICKEWAETYPREPLPHAFLAGFVDLALADYDEAMEEAGKAIDLAPDRGYPYFLLGDDALYAGQLKVSEEALRRAFERKATYARFPILQYDLAFLQDDSPGMQRAVEAAKRAPDLMDWMADRQAFALAYAGQLRHARVLSGQAMEVARQEGDSERAAQFAIRPALWEAFFGEAHQARRDAAAALGLARNREVEYGAAVALALAGDSRQAQMLADRLESGFPEDTSVRFSYVPVIHAILALKRGDPAQAVKSLEAAVPYEMGAPRCAVVESFGSLYPILFRGEAYLAAGRGHDALQEFQKIIDHRTVMVGDSVSVMALYGLARSYALSGDSGNALRQYKELLTLWSDADPDLPVLKQARTELAKLP